MKTTTVDTLKPVSRRKTIAMPASTGVFGFTGLTAFKNDTHLLSDSRSNNTINSPGNNGMTMKTIGILGGLGPQATMDLEMRIHKVSQQLVTPSQNNGYPPMIVQYYRHTPVLLTKEHMPVFPWQPDSRMLDVAKNLGRMSDFIVIPSNGIHLFQKEIEEASGRKVISMIDATLEEVKRRGWQKAGVLGLMNTGIYTKRLKQLGIAFETIDGTLQQKLNASIFKVMEGREDPTDREIIREAIRQLRNRDVDGIIPAVRKYRCCLTMK